MPRVVISAKNFLVPRICVCCGGPPQLDVPDNGGHKGKRGTRSLSFPACAVCAGHYIHDAQRLGLVPGFDPKAPAPQRLLTCEATGRLFDFVDWHGTEVTILFASPRYAEAFVGANRAAGKNILRVDVGPAHFPAWPAPAAGGSAWPIVVGTLVLVGAAGAYAIVSGGPATPAAPVPPRAATVAAPPPAELAPAAPSRGGRHCARGCPCGNSCIPCNHRCRH